CSIKGIPFGSREEAVKNPAVIEKYQRELDRLNQGFGQWEKVKKFVLLHNPWTIDAGELTPKLSLKRKAILQHHEEAINSIYEENQYEPLSLRILQRRIQPPQRHRC